MQANDLGLGAWLEMATDRIAHSLAELLHRVCFGEHGISDTASRISALLSLLDKKHEFSHCQSPLCDPRIPSWRPKVMGSLLESGPASINIVALKVLPAALAADPQFCERFKREAKSISALSHPNSCTLFDV